MWKPSLRSKKSSRRRGTTVELRAELDRALAHGRTHEALEIYQLLEKSKPDEPRWSHRKGDLLLRTKRRSAALKAYQRAAYLYSARGFDARAIATAKLVLAIDPHDDHCLEQVSRVASGRLLRQRRIEAQLGVRRS